LFWVSLEIDWVKLEKDIGDGFELFSLWIGGMGLMTFWVEEIGLFSLWVGGIGMLTSWVGKDEFVSVEVDEAICLQFGCLIKHFRERTKGKKK
jgi:hypothetical protein